MKIKPEQYRNNKNGSIYTVDGMVKNTTNAVDGQIMMLYHNERGEQFARELTEFYDNFTKV